MNNSIKTSFEWILPSISVIANTNLVNKREATLLLMDQLSNLNIGKVVASHISNNTAAMKIVKIDKLEAIINFQSNLGLGSQ